MIYSTACHKICGCRHHAGGPDDTKGRNPDKRDHLKEGNPINMFSVYFSNSANEAGLLLIYFYTLANDVNMRDDSS